LRQRRSTRWRDEERDIFNVKRGCFILTTMVIALTVPVLTAWAGERALGDPRQMTFQPVEFTPPEPDRVVLENGMGVYRLEDHE
jgi:zinc protease